MNEIEVGKAFIHKQTGVEMAKILYYYGYHFDSSYGEMKIVCPFHEDVNPSMIVNLDKGSFFCFGCGKSGNAFDFVNFLNPDENDLKSCIRFHKILKSNKVKAINLSRNKKQKKQSRELYNIAYDYYNCLSNVDWVNDKSYEIDNSRKYMLKRGFYPKTLNKCQAKITYNKQYEIIFPMLDNGTFKGWVCRTTLKDVEKKRKYLYNEGFSRGNTLVGNYNNCEYVFVVEGYMDRLKFIQYGVNNVVSILGWKMSREQEEKIKRSNVKVVISALDNDECGRKGTKYLRTIFKNVIRFCYLKGFKDPGEMSKRDFNIMYKKTLERMYENGFIGKN